MRAAWRMGVVATLATACGRSDLVVSDGRTCGPDLYIEGDACLPLQIGDHPEGATSSPADASAEPAEEAPADASAFDEGADAIDDAPTLTCEGGTPVAECVQYYAYLERCFNRPDLLALACQDSLLAKPDADVMSIEALCADNLQRIMSACR